MEENDKNEDYSRWKILWHYFYIMEIVNDIITKYYIGHVLKKISKNVLKKVHEVLNDERNNWKNQLYC